MVDVNSVDRAKVQQDVEKMNAVEGTYTGQITSAKTGQTVGFASLHLDADSVIYTPPTDPRSQLRSVLRATMEIQLPERKLSLNFNESYFDVDTKDIIVGYNPGTPSATGFKLKGKHADGVIKGEIHAAGFPHEGLITELHLNGPSSETNQSIVSDGSSSTLSEHVKRDYRGVSRSLDSKPVISISAHSVTHEEEFLRLLLPYQTVKVSYDMGSSMHILFNGARWDSRSGRLTGESQRSTSTGEIVVHNLDCLSTSTVSGRLLLPDTLDCTVTASNRGIVGQFQLIGN